MVTAQDDLLLAELRRLLAEAAAEGRPLVVGGARHSMGGQSLYPGASAVTAASLVCDLDMPRRRCRVSAGARWKDVLPILDRAGLSVPVMQSNSDFSVGGTLSVNGHGWAVPYGAFASSVRSFRLLLADGTAVTCSAAQNPELFRAALGGYGLLGIVLDVDLDLVPNAALRPAFARTDAQELASRLGAALDSPTLRMAYARLSVAPRSFLTDALLVTFDETDGSLTPLSSEDVRFFGLVSRTMLRAQTGSSAGKGLRWWAEAHLASRLAPSSVSRNRLLAQPTSSLGDPGVGRTDILHEYFLPLPRLPGFLDACRKIIPASGQDLLNVTLRYVAADRTSLLSFAPEPRIAAVMLFSQALTAEAEQAMRHATELLVGEALSIGGSFYLPYRLHARRDQVARAYPGLGEFLSVKRKHDPQNRFRNQLFDAYLD
jgi:FAD/FMN-containing dehydrogenase